MVIIGLAKIIRPDIISLNKTSLEKKTSAGTYRYLWWIRLWLTCWQWFHSGRIQSQRAWPRTVPVHSVAVGSASSPSAVDQQHSYVWWTAGPKIIKTNIGVPSNTPYIHVLCVLIPCWSTCTCFVFIRYSIIFVLFFSSDKRCMRLCITIKSH